MTSPALDDLSVCGRGSDDCLDHYTVSSWLTRGRCAEVAVSRSDPTRFHIRPFLIPSYMQGITDGLIREAVLAFRAKGDKPCQSV
ncbi:MAG: hypothetical protein WCY98_08570 [Castellaniella sp.]|jgi:hypothetical protein